ncbi:MAG: FAD-binding protein [Deltaproteobacteria bacterium]|nr:MAG: FAD-binding protein [Deltaproteobacteria bacterium]
MEAGVKESLREIVGEENFTDSLIDLIAYAKDASEFKQRPDAAVWPINRDQISAILRPANKEKFPVVARGAGTSLAGLAVPQEGGLILDLGRMDQIIQINIEDRLAIVQPGVVYDDLARALAPHGFFFPPDPASGAVCTLGGNVATNAGGIKGAKYGTTKDYVLGLEVVLADGQVLRTGSKCMKSVSGFDLTRLFVGSEGTLGVITEITLKINPKPPLTQTAMATFDMLEDAGTAVSEIMYSGILPSALEVVNQQTLMAINQNTDLNLPEVEALLVAEVDGYTREETEFQLDKIIDIFGKNKASTVRKAESQEEAEALWSARKSAYGVMARINYNLFVEDLSVPMSKMADILRVISDIAEKYDLKIPTVGHVGDGNLHPVISFDGTNPEEVKRVEEATEELFKKVINLGGTLTGEHGIGLAKAPLMPLEHEDVAMDVMRSLKRLLDPHNILNPGKMGLEV